MPPCTSRTAGCLALLIGLLLAGCSNVRSPDRLGGGGRINRDTDDSERCGTAGLPRPLGQRWVRFGEYASTSLAYQGRDVGKRIGVLKGQAARWGELRGGELRRTGAALAAAPAAPFVDASLHWDSLSHNLTGTLKRARRDTRCFWSRAWHSLKLLD